MSTPTDRQTAKERKPAAGQNQQKARGPADAARRIAGTPQTGRSDQRLAQREAKQPEPPTKTAREPGANTQVSPAATPPAPKPRDPAVARRQALAEQRRAEILARQQERRRELQQAKRQKLSIRYGVMVAAVLLVSLVTFFAIEGQPVLSAISGAAVLICLMVFLAAMTMMPVNKSSHRTQVTSVAPEPDASPENGAPPKTAPPNDSASGPEERTR